MIDIFNKYLKEKPLIIDGCALVDINVEQVRGRLCYKFDFIFSNGVIISFEIEDNFYKTYGKIQFEQVAVPGIIEMVISKFREYCAQNVKINNSNIDQAFYEYKSSISRELDDIERFSIENQKKNLKRITTSTSQRERDFRRRQADKMWDGMNKRINLEEIGDKTRKRKRKRTVKKEQQENEILSRFQDILEEE